jgi:flagellar hook-length control protein FliK
LINLNQLLDQLQPTPDSSQKSTAGLEAPKNESFIFSDVLGEAQGLEKSSGVLDLEGGSLALEDWVESSLLELNQEQQEALLAALFTLEEGLTVQVDSELNLGKAQAQVNAFWSALEGLLEEWRSLMSQGDLLRAQLSQPLEEDAKRGVIQRLEHLSKLESEGIWDQIIHWIGRFMERDQGSETPSSFSLVEMENAPQETEEKSEGLIESQKQQGEQDMEVQLEPAEPEPVMVGSEVDVLQTEIEAVAAIEIPKVEYSQVTDLLTKETTSKVVDSELKAPVLSEEPRPESLGETKGLERIQEKNQALQQKILKALEAVAKRAQGGADQTLANLANEKIEINQGDPNNMWGRIRRWLSDRLTQENISKVQTEAALTKDVENLSKGGAVEFLKFVATLQRKGFSQPSGLEAEALAAEDGVKRVPPEVRRHLPLQTPPVIRQASYGQSGQDLTGALLQYSERGVAEAARESVLPEGVKAVHENVSGNKETQEAQVRNESKNEGLSSPRDHGRWDPSVFQRFANSTRAQFQLWADRKFVAMQVQLDPEALGKMQLKTILENGRIGVLVQVEQMAAKDLLNSHLDHLRSILEEKGLEVAAFHVEVRQQQTGGGQGFYGPKKHGPQFDLEALMQGSDDGDLQVESPILRGLINKVA